MKLKTVFRFTLIIAVVGLTACTAFKLRDANDQLTTYYYAKMEAEKNNDWKMLEGTIASLSKLAQDAARQAEKEKDNVLNRIAFYRIATTAAWQAGDKNVLTYAGEGEKLCTDDNFKTAPRDCSMLIVFPIFASVDEITDKFISLRDKVTGAPENERAKYAGETKRLFDDYRNALTMVLARRPKIIKNGASPNFLKALDLNTGKLLCKRIDDDAFGLISTAKGDVKKARCEVYELKKQALDAGLDQSSASCLPKSEDQLKKPQNCQ